MFIFKTLMLFKQILDVVGLFLYFDRAKLATLA